MSRRYWLTPVHIRYEMTRRAERALTWFVWRLPRKLVFRAAIRVIAAATTGPYSDQVVPELTAMDALQRWDAKTPKAA